MDQLIGHDQIHTALYAVIKNKTMNKLIIPNQIEANKPKPTKAQLVEALLIQAKENWTQENVKRRALRDQITLEAKTYVEKVLREKKNIFSNSEININSRYDKSIVILFEVKDKKTTEFCEKHENARDIYFNEQAVKEKIQKSLRNPNPLLNKEYKNSIKDLLDQVMGNTKVIEA